MFRNFVDFGGPHKDQKKNFFSKFFSPSFSSKNLSFKKCSITFSKFFFFALHLMKNYKNSLLKNHRYGNASRENTVIAVWRKISEVIEKSLSELLKKRRINSRSGSRVITIPKSIFSHDGALILLCPLYYSTKIIFLYAQIYEYIFCRYTHIYILLT